MIETKPCQIFLRQKWVSFRFLHAIDNQMYHVAQFSTLNVIWGTSYINLKGIKNWRLTTFRTGASYLIGWKFCFRQILLSGHRIEKSLGHESFGSKIAMHFWKVHYLSIKTKSMLSFSGPLRFHRNSLNTALFSKQATRLIDLRSSKWKARK